MCVCVWVSVASVACVCMKTLKKSTKEMCQPSVSALEAITILAEAPIKVPLPPKHAPKASALHVCVCV